MPVSLSESAGRLRSRVAEGPSAALQLRDRVRESRPVLFRSPAFLLDVAMLILASAAALLSAPSAGVATDVLAFVVFGVLVLGCLSYMGLYRSSFALHFLDDARRIIGATAIVGMAMTFVGVLIFDDPSMADQAARAWLFASTYLIAARGAAHIVTVSRRRAGAAGLPTLIVGAGHVGREFADRLADRPEFGLQPVALLDDDPLEFDSPSRIPVLGSGSGADGRGYFGSGLESVIRDREIAHVIVSFSVKSHAAELDLVRRCQDMGVTVSVLPRLFEGVTDRLSLERIGGMPLISVHPTDPLGWQFAVKYAGDRIIAALAIFFLSPILAAAAIATRISLGRPIIFEQRRVGLDGNEFPLYKFRTMRPPTGDEAPEADLDDRLASGLAPGGVEGADRRTAVGAFMRKTSIDELPQLFNVLRGDMSLVGPRPERPTYARLFDEEVYRYADRHRVKSGITGWSQVHGLRGSTSINDRVEWDNYYIENRSFWLDLKIMALTIPALLRGAGE
jgi:exopolysaccharide biosynthesis polyprenyl glycosylphosphotransferase